MAGRAWVPVVSHEKEREKKGEKKRVDVEFH
jgi:hypothetical protein